jgi:hypothetical protein
MVVKVYNRVAGARAEPRGRGEHGGTRATGGHRRATRRAGRIGAPAQAASARRTVALQAAGRGRCRRPMDRREGPHARHHAAAQGHRRRGDHEAQVRLIVKVFTHSVWFQIFTTLP